MSVKSIEAFLEALNNVISQKETSQIELQGLGSSKETFLRIDDLYNNRITMNQVKSKLDKDVALALINFYKHINNNSTAGFKDAYKNLQLSTLNSYFTPKEIIESIVAPLSKMFDPNQEIKILEPSAGTGNFIGALEQHLPKAQITAIEKDFFTGHILKNNHPNVDVRIQGYEEENFNNNFDLSISNIPFGNLNVLDLTRKDKRQLYNDRIHNYFFLKGIDDIKPGGVMAYITTANFSDSRANYSLREYLMNNTNLISAVRLPNSVFTETGTKVTTDLVIVQKPLEKKQRLTQHEEQYINSVHVRVNDQSFYMNEYLEQEKQNILGDLNTYIFHNSPKLTVTSDQNTTNISKTLKGIIEGDLDRLKHIVATPKLEAQPVAVQAAQVATPKTETPAPAPSLFSFDPPKAQQIEDQPQYTDGNLFIENNKVYIYKSTGDHELINTKEIDRVSKIIYLRQTYIKLFQAQKKQLPEVDKIREEFNHTYDMFAFQYGYLNEELNMNLIILDSQFDILLNLELPEKNYYVKASIFDNPIAQEDIKSVAISIEDALLLSLNNFNKVDIEFMADKIGKTQKELLKEGLEKGLLFIEPLLENNRYTEKNQIVDKATFASGLIETKLNLYRTNKISSEEAIYINQTVLDNAINTLEEKVPYKLSIDEIDPDVGEPWIPISYFESFATEFFETECNIVKTRSAKDFRVKLRGSHKTANEYFVRKDRGYVRAADMLNYALSDNIPEFTKKVTIDGQEQKQVDRKVIDEVTIRVEAIKEGWRDWLKGQKEITKILEEHYHSLNNAYVKKEIDGSYIKIPELTLFTPHQHQLDAAATVLHNEGGILDHKVGYGKTLSMGIITHKFVQTGISPKNLLVAMNANYTEVYENIKKAFPHLKMLLLTNNDFHKSKQQEALLKVANNNWDLVVMPHSCIDRIPGEPEIEMQIINETNENIRLDLEAMKENSMEFTKSERASLVQRQENNEIRLKILYDQINQKATTGLLTFNDLGFSHMMVDESHQFKNLAFTTRHTRVSGIGSPQGNLKTTKMQTLIRALQEKHGGDKGVTFSSATPISNSLAELYLIFKYLRPNKMKEMNISSFDQWARLFARKTSSYEQNVVGLIKSKERFRYFVKVPELAKLYNDIAHVADQRTFKIDAPDLDVKFIEIQPHQELKDYLDNLKEFMQTRNPSLLNAGKDYTEDQLQAVGLIATNYGKKASIDLRLVNDKIYEFNQESKINIMADNVVRVYNMSDEHKGTQFIMCDMSTPSKERFNVYDETKRLLIAKGIPEHEIAFIHDSGSSIRKKEKMIKDFNQGNYRIILGSTQKLGTGVNAQQKAVAIHHVDLPWRPSDFDQRNGRAARQGNQVAKKFYDNKVMNFIYGVKGTTDGYIFNTLAVKSGFIEQLKHATIALRTLDEGAIDANGNMSYADFTAIIADDTLFVEKVKLEKELAALEQKQYAFTKKLTQSKGALSNIELDIEKNQKNLDKAIMDQTMYNKITLSEDQKKFSPAMEVVINDQTIKVDAFEALGKVLHKKLSDVFRSQDYKEPLATHPLGFEIQVLPVIYGNSINEENYKIVVQAASKLKYVHGYNILTKDNTKAGEYFKNALDKTQTLPKTLQGKIEDFLKKKEVHEKILLQKSPYALKITEIKKELVQVIKKIDNQKDQDQNPDKDQNQNNKPKGPKL